MKVYGQVSALDDESSNNVYNTGTGSRHMPSSHVGQYGLSDDVSDCDYAEPHAVLPHGLHGLSPGHDQIYQAINVPPVISHSSLSSPSSMDLGHTRPGLYGTYQKPTYQKIKKSRKYRSSTQNIYQSVSNCQPTMSKYDHGSASKFEPQVAQFEPQTFKYESKNSIYTTNRIPSLPPSANLEVNAILITIVLENENHLKSFS